MTPEQQKWLATLELENTALCEEVVRLRAAVKELLLTTKCRKPEGVAEAGYLFSQPCGHCKGEGALKTDRQYLLSPIAKYQEELAEAQSNVRLLELRLGRYREHIVEMTPRHLHWVPGDPTGETAAGPSPGTK